MKVKIAGFVIASSDPKWRSTSIFDHEPSVAGFLRVTEWVEVDLPDRSEAVLAAEQKLAIAGECAELRKKLATLEAA